MITLDYRLTETRSNRPTQVNWASADAATLRYSAFLGDQIFVVEEHDFSARWGWVPLLDFAAALTGITRGLEMGNASGRFEFTESDAALDLHREGDRVRIVSNYVQDTAQVSLTELVEAVESYARRILSEALAAHPALAENDSFRQWFPASVN